jgi:hypothetical protein
LTRLASMEAPPPDPLITNSSIALLPPPVRLW